MVTVLLTCTGDGMHQDSSRWPDFGVASKVLKQASRIDRNALLLGVCHGRVVAVIRGHEVVDESRCDICGIHGLQQHGYVFVAPCKQFCRGVAGLGQQCLLRDSGDRAMC